MWMPWVPSPNLAPGAGRALQLSWPTDGGWRQEPLPGGCCCSRFPASASWVFGCRPKMPKHTDPAFSSGPNLSPASAGPTAIRHEVSVSPPTSGHIWAQHQELSSSWPQPSCSPHVQLQHSWRGSCQHPALSQERQNKCHSCARERAGFNNSKDKTENRKKTWKTMSTGTSPTHRTTSGFWDRSSVLIPLRMEISVTLQR